MSPIVVLFENSSVSKGLCNFRMIVFVIARFESGTAQTGIAPAVTSRVQKFPFQPI
jgi:hypothetical protein